MSFEVFLVIATVFEIAVLGFVASLVYRTREKMDADDAALYMQGRRVQEILREMRAELLRS
jgi:hypothetical protein